MQRYKSTNVHIKSRIRAIKFDPQKKPWPKCIIPWAMTLPRDRSFGYVLTPLGIRHVVGGDYIAVNDAGEAYVFENEARFEELWKLIE